MAVDAERAKSLFLAASDLSDAAERVAYLDRECGGDAGLRGRVESLLRANNAAPLPPADAGDGTSAHVAERLPETEDYRDPTARVGAVLAGKYKLIEEIGEGGMGSVYMAQQTEPVKRAVAVKVIKAGMDSRAVLARFEAERQALAMMDHPNIARVLDAGTTEGGRPFFVMELVKGMTITQFCDERKLTPRQRLELFVPVCQAIQHAHQKGIIHRDIKPSNVLIALYDDRPVPKVIDFGVAKAAGAALIDKTLMTGFGAVVGTPEYMSPEQANLNNLDIDTRSDVYSLGVLLYELLTGSTPVDRKSLGKAAILEILRIVREVEAPKPSHKLSTSDALPSVAACRGTEPAKLSKLMKGELDWVLLKALEKDRARRYETANGLARDIQRYLADEVVEARPPSTTYRLKKFIRRHKGQVIAASLVLLALVAGMVGTSVGLVQAQTARRAESERAEGEWRAKLDAEAQKEQAQKRLTQIEKANDLLGSIFENLDPKEIARNERPLQVILVEKLDKAVAQLEGESIGDALVVAAMQARFGESLLGLGESGKAIVLLEKALTTQQAKLGTDHPDTLTSMNNLAAAYQDVGKLDLALSLFEETLKLKKVRLGPQHPDTLTGMHNLANAYKDAAKLDLALPLFEETLRLKNAKLGSEHPDTLSSMGTLAMAYQAAGKRDLALPLLEETLKLRKARLGSEHLDTLNSMNNLAVAYRDAGKLDLALPLFEETLRLRKARLGLEHPVTLNSMNNLAVAYRDAGRLDLALPLLEETLKLRKARLGPEHADTLNSMNNLASAYKRAGKLDLALPLLEETLKLRKARLGPEHPDTLNSMNNLAGAYWSAKQLDKSIPLFEETSRRLAAKLGRDHPDTLIAVANLGVNYKDAGRLAEAIPLLEDVYRAAKKSPKPRWVGNQLLDAYAKAGENAKRADLLQEQLAEDRKAIPNDSPQLAGLLAQVGMGLLERKQWTKAEPLLRECLGIHEKTQANLWSTFNTKSLLGGALLGQKKYADAEPLLLAGYQGMKQREKMIPPTGQVHLREALDRLIELSTVTNKPDQVKKWQAERAKYPLAAPMPRE